MCTQISHSFKWETWCTDLEYWKMRQRENLSQRKDCFCQLKTKLYPSYCCWLLFECSLHAFQWTLMHFSFCRTNSLFFIIWWSGHSDQIFDNDSEELLAGWMKTSQRISMSNKSWLLVKHCEFTLFLERAWLNIPSGKICHNEAVFVPALPWETSRLRRRTCPMSRGSFVVEQGI